MMDPRPIYAAQHYRQLWPLTSHIKRAGSILVNPALTICVRHAVKAAVSTTGCIHPTTDTSRRRIRRIRRHIRGHIRGHIRDRIRDRIRGHHGIRPDRRDSHRGPLAIRTAMLRDFLDRKGGTSPK